MIAFGEPSNPLDTLPVIARNSGLLGFGLLPDPCRLAIGFSAGALAAKDLLGTLSRVGNDPFGFLASATGNLVGPLFRLKQS